MIDELICELFRVIIIVIRLRVPCRVVVTELVLNLSLSSSSTTRIFKRCSRILGEIFSF